MLELKPHCVSSSLIRFFMVALIFKNLCHMRTSKPLNTLCAVAAAPCCINAVVCQIQIGVTSHGLTGDRKKNLKPAKVGGELSVGERPQLPAVSLRNHLSTRSAEADLTGA